MAQSFGYHLPKAMHPEFGAIVKAACDAEGRELQPQEIFDLFHKEYFEVKYPYHLKRYKLFEEHEGQDGETQVHFEGLLRFQNVDHEISGVGNGPIDAFFGALRSVGINDYEFVSYSEHAISSGADSKALSYIQIRTPEDKMVFGVGLDSNISLASIKGIICAINRACRS